MNVVIKVNDEIKEKMIEYYKDKKRESHNRDSLLRYLAILLFSLAKKPCFF